MICIMVNVNIIVILRSMGKIKKVSFGEYFRKSKLETCGRIHLSVRVPKARQTMPYALM